jgi:5-methylcytosine-specific restriction endonuclease McrA
MRQKEITNYATKLTDPRWQRRRLEVFDRDKWTCRMCGDKATSLQVHHLKYNGEPWEAKKADLITLCHDCHPEVEKMKKNGIKPIFFITIQS